MKESKATLKIAQGPHRLHLLLIWLVTKIGYMPRVTVVTVPGKGGLSLRISYRVYYMSWAKGERLCSFVAFPAAVYTLSERLAKYRRRDFINCDEIVCDPDTRMGQIWFHPSNPSY